MKVIRENKLIKVLSLNSVSVALSFVLGIFSTKIISFFLGTSGMALIGGFRNFSTMLKSIATLGISNSAVKLFVENKDNKSELSVIYSTFFWLFLFVSLVIGGTTLLFAGSISQFIFFTDSYVIPIQYFALALPLMIINTFWLAIYNGLEKFKRIIYIQIASNIIVFGATAFLIWKQGILGGLLSVAVGEVLMVLVTLLYIGKDKSFVQFDLHKIITKKYLVIIQRFALMALLSAVLAPLTLIIIRNTIVDNYSIAEAGIWDAINRLSGFYMLFLSSGLSMYYMPKLASLQTDAEFKSELKIYFKTLVPLFLLMLIVIFFAKGIILKLAFTEEFDAVSDLLIWQLLGDFLRVMTLAFGFQVLVKTMMKRYFLIEIVFNLSYLLLSFYLIKVKGIEGVLQAYVYANAICLAFVLVLFRKLFSKS